MYILGVLSVIQILFLPGLILMKLFHGVKGFIQKLIYSFGLSLIFNHLFVVLLTHLKINQPVFHYILFCAEFIIVIYLYWSDLKEPMVSKIINLYQEFANNLNVLFKPASDEISIQSVLKNIIVIIFLGWSVYSILWTISLFFNNLGSVFTIWDSVVSWNHWAVEWFSNSHPFDTKRYAQLIPTNFSITYSFMRSDEIQSFAIGIMPVFAVYFLLLMFDLGIKKKEYGYLIGLVVSQYILKRFYLPLISSGYVDVALMFFTFLSVYTLLISTTQTNEKHLRSTAFLGFIFAAGTALTKQNGLWVLAVYPVLAYFIIFSQIESLNKKDKFILLAKYMGIALMLLLPWYIFNELRIASGAKTNVLMLMSQEHHSGLTLVERLIKAYKDLSIYAYLYPLVLFSLPFIKKDERKIITMILIPYSLIWAFLFSLYPRNLSIGFALLGFASGVGAAWLTDFFLSLSSRIKIHKWPTWIIVLCILILGLMPAIILKDNILLENQNERQKYILQSDVNLLLYDYFEKEGGLEPIFTNYPLRFLPGFEDLQINIGGFEDYDFYNQTRKKYPEVIYMLISLFKDNGEVVNEIREGAEQGLYEIIFKQDRYLFVKILQD